MGSRRPLKALVIGYGSIGERHVRVLTELGCEVAVLSGRSVRHAPCFSTLTQALSDWRPGYVVVANLTSGHHQAVGSLAEQGFRGRVLVEKPLFDRLMPVPRHDFSHAAVAYNLRCHPLLNQLHRLLDGGKAWTASVYVGSYLPNWRPATDYRSCYSAFTAQGGGVLRDLSHELDYIRWLFGPWRRLTASGGHLSALAIESEDAFTVVMETERCPLVSVHMNYLDRVPRREIVVNTDRHTIRGDQIRNTLQVDDIVESMTVAGDDTYRAEHQAMLDGRIDRLCSFEEGLETLATIEAAERAAASHTWMAR